MDGPDDRNWGDPYIGLRNSAAQILGMVEAARVRPMQRLGFAYQTPFGSPSIWDDIASFFQSILYWVNPENFIPFLYNIAVYPAIAWLRKKVFDPIKDAVVWAIASLEGWIGGWGKDARSLMSSIRDFVRKPIDNLRAWFIGHVQWQIENIRESLASAYTWLRDTLGGIVQGVKDNIHSVYAWFRDTLGGIVKGVRDNINSVYVWLRDTLGGIVQGVKDNIHSVHTWLRDTFGGIGERIIKAVQGVTKRIAGTFVGWWTRTTGAIQAAIVNAWNTMVQGLINLFKGFYWFVRDAASKAVVNMKPYVKRWISGFQTLPATFLNFVAKTAGTNLAQHPERALTTVGALFSIALAAGTGAHVLSTCLNFIPTTDWVGAAQLSAFLAQAAAFEPLTKATYGVLINEALTQPLRYYWNDMLRPNLPTEGTIFIMGRKRGLNRSQFGIAMAKHGLPDWWIDKEYQFFWTDPSPYWLLRMSEHATPALQPSSLFLPWLQEWLPGWRSDPMAWFKMKLLLAGFEDTDIPAFIDGFQRRRVGPAITQVKTSVRAMVREGYWGRDDVVEALSPMGVRPEEIDYIIIAEDIDYQNRYLDGQVKYYTEGFRKGEFSRQDLSLALSTIIIKPGRVAQIVAREEIRALPKPKPVVPAKEDPLVVSLRRQAITSWTKAYRDWEIDLDDLTLGLTIVVGDRFLADKLVAAERTRYRPPPPPPVPPKEDPLVAKTRRAAIASWVKQFRDEEIDAAMLEMGLTPLIPDPTLVRQVVQIEQLRARPAPEIIPPPEEDPSVAALRQEYVRGHIEMFRKRLIDVNQLYSYLLADGLAPALARATAITQSLKRVKVPPLESPYFQSNILRELTDQAVGSYQRMYELGQITLQELEAYLAGAGVDPALITYIGDTQSLNRFLRTVGV